MPNLAEEVERDCYVGCDAYGGHSILHTLKLLNISSHGKLLFLLKRMMSSIIVLSVSSCPSIGEDLKIVCRNLGSRHSFNFNVYSTSAPDPKMHMVSLKLG